jgi:D-alanine-D-alanine ligase
MTCLRVLVLVREGLVPPDSLDGQDAKDIARWKTEYDVLAALRKIGHEVQPLGVFDDLGVLRDQILGWKPHLVFMLLEEFHGIGTYDQAVVSYLELMRQPYTGCNPSGLLLSHNKALAKEILSFHRIPTPRFAVFRKGKKLQRGRRLRFPLLVKSVIEEASLGISQASIVKDDESLAERVCFVHEKVGSDAMAEEYIEGRELYVGVLGNQRLETFPVWEMVFSKMPDDVAPIATAKVKWDAEYQKRHGIRTQAARLEDGGAERIVKLCTRVYRALHLSGYARIDLRMRADGRVFVLEANPNPNLAHGEDFAESAKAGGVKYEALLRKIINLGLRYKAPWKE